MIFYKNILHHVFNSPNACIYEQTFEQVQGQHIDTEDSDNEFVYHYVGN